MTIRQKYYTARSKTIHGLMLLKNKRIDKHVVVFESDDWGSIRMPSIATMRKLENIGVNLALPQSYDSLDTLASNDDLELLMDVLSSVKDARGHSALLTLNCCVANPDFQRIRESGFNEYYYEPFTETLKRYPHHDRSYMLWKEGMAHGVFAPQFHGREHLNPQKWMRYLREGNRDVRIAFDEECYSVRVPLNDDMDSFLEAYKIDTEEECGFVKTSIREGLSLFKQLFGFCSESIIAPCFTWDSFVEEEAFAGGVKYIQGGYIQRHSTWQKKLGKRVTGHYLGEMNERKQVYLVRNCTFEPSLITTDNADSCFASIRKAFNWHLPAIVSCHRLNFIGDLNLQNRDRNLKEYKRLLDLITLHYPEVEFMSSNELGRLYLQTNNI